jgi:hypothetical protein
MAAAKKPAPKTAKNAKPTPSSTETITLPLAYVLGLEEVANATSDLMATGLNIENVTEMDKALTALEALGDQLLTDAQKTILGLD